MSPLPPSPYARSEGMTSVALPPSFIMLGVQGNKRNNDVRNSCEELAERMFPYFPAYLKPSCHPLITPPKGKLRVCPRSTDESKTVPSVKVP